MWGASPDEIAGLEATIGTNDSAGITIEVEPENADAVRLYLAMRTQWRFTARTIGVKGGSFTMQVRTGLEYSAIPAIAQWLGIGPSARTLDQLRTLEEESLDLFATRDDAAIRRLR